MFSKKNLFISLGILLFATGCSNVKNLSPTAENNIINKESALQIRDIQTRTFDNTSKEDLVNAIVDTLLDDGYFVTMIDTNSGVISAKNNKNNPELNLVAVIKEIKNENFLVRFSLNGIDKSLAFKSYIIIEDDVIYRYLFDKLRKSLFLDQEFYKVPSKEEVLAKQEIIVQKETIIVHLPEKKKDVIKKIAPKKYISKKCSTNKCKDSTPLVYSVQFLCDIDKNLALREFKKLKDQNHDVRIHPYHEYQVVRLGRYKTRTEAQEVMNKFKDSYPEVSIVGFKSKR
ncbi:MAG: SPOR domain-containing protein [Aliarcobacter sp.]|nr:SPOR domain-containing protein [Aliarcobacter sp.]